MKASKIPRWLVTAVAVCCGVFSYASGVIAADWTGGPCSIGISCSVSRGNIVYFGFNYHWLQLRVGTDYVACVYTNDAVNPAVFTWSPSEEDLASQNWWVYRSNGTTCGNGTTETYDYGTGFWDQIPVVPPPPPAPTEPTQAQLESYLPTWHWGDSTSTGNGTATTTFEDHLNASMGAATATFPLCLSYSWSELLDTLVGITDGSAAPQTMVFDSHIGNGNATRTLALDLGRSSVASDTHMIASANKISGFLLASAWAIFGLYVIFNLFLGHKPEHV
jgi:hypothetical protein